MILTAIDFETAEDRQRVSVRGRLRVKIRAIADDSATGVIEVRRGYGPGGPEVAYDTPVTLDLTGETVTELTVDDCPDIVLVVTTAGSGDVDIEISTATPCEDSFEVTTFHALSEAGPFWRSPSLDPGTIERISIVGVLESAQVKAIVNLRASLDAKSSSAYPISTLAIDLDNGVTSFTVSAMTELELNVRTLQAGLIADFFIYRISNPYREGLLPSNVALTDQLNTFTELQTLSGGINLSGAITVENVSSFEGAIGIKGQKALRLYDADDSVYIGFKTDAIVGIGDGNFDYLVPHRPSANGDRLETTATGTLSWYTPKATAGDTFPLSPDDGDTYLRTDLDMPELFYWDDTRSKWLGELRTLQWGRSAAATSGSLDLRWAGSVQGTTSRGMLTPNALTIVGAEIFSAADFTAELRYREGSSDVATLMTITTARYASDHTLNQEMDADAGWPHKWFRIGGISYGTLNNPIVSILVRRHET